jgi:hypothetical protein
VGRAAAGRCSNGGATISVAPKPVFSGAYNGSMLLSDDFNGAVYRITYGPQQQVSMRH